MKNLFIVAVLFFTFQLSNAQGNLQYNKTVYETFVSTETANPSFLKEFSGFTVPDGKIWKVNFFCSVKIVPVGEIFTYNITDNITPNVWFVKTGDDGSTMIGNRLFFNPNEQRQEYLLSAGTYNFRHNSPNNTYNTNVTVNGTEFNIILE